MVQLIKKFEHKHHLQHLVNVLPFITFIFGVQCYIFYQITDGVSISTYALTLAITLSAFITAFITYDSYYQIHVFDKFLHLNFPFTLLDKKIAYSEIEDVIVLDEECLFSTIIIKRYDGKKQVLYFVDDPKDFKTLLLSLKNQGDVAEPKAA